MADETQTEAKDAANDAEAELKKTADETEESLGPGPKEPGERETRREDLLD